MANFSKRHYEFVATLMQNTCPRGVGNAADHIAAHKQWQSTVANFANEFAMENSSFKSDRFVKACQPGANVKART